MENIMKSFVIAAGIVIAAIAAGPGAAKTARHYQHTHRALAQPQQHVACTVLGCMPVPTGCGQTIGRTPGGLPTGYDVIVCPPGIDPFH
jgi:hypothetical protein